MAKYEPVGDGNIGPMTTVRIAKAGGAAWNVFNKDALLDTGSPWTYIPEEVHAHLDLGEVCRMNVTGIEARGKSAIVCHADLTLTGPEFQGRAFPAHRVLVHDWPIVLLGRDILAYFDLAFDGVASEWRILKIHP